MEENRQNWKKEGNNNKEKGIVFGNFRERKRKEN